MEGFFLVYKNKFVTSHDVVKQIKKKFNFLKVGHSGTLDPLAEGLLIVFINKATKLAFLFENLDKKYEGTFVFNQKYDTLDIFGKLIDVKNDIISDEQVQRSFEKFHKKKYLQKPPMHSSIKIEGQKMYNLARKNIIVEIPKREVIIHSLLKTSLVYDNQVDFLTHVSKGTYVRSLAADIALDMNTYGALKKLKRISIGNYLLNDAKTVEQISLKDLIMVETLFSNYDELILNDYLIKLVKNGIYLDQRQIITNKPFIVKNNKNKWIAYYEKIVKNTYAPKYFF
ncbi:pseudouridine synthase B [Candidatus Phytoplasma mali]|uniref:tRNA pseudouridine synthase B n=1 Tax=Phytoplasma mali (strain AT) TaxID=482235 RepID=B3QZX6_PHYMT|nr:tRNA pseudouridine(55) synthase TruB [Candidatus Phytoplasma mali]CAP18513.1 pseudouridine synthase B [Candidatus Phytoplasma mali]